MGPRPLDIDILMYGETILNDPILTIPHPRITERKFVLIPLLELKPLLLEPGSGIPYMEYLRKLPSQGIYYHTVKSV